MSGPEGPEVSANRIQVKGICKSEALATALASSQATRSVPFCQQSCMIQVLVRVRPPVGTEVNGELAVACSPSQEHVQARICGKLLC